MPIHALRRMPVLAAAAAVILFGLPPAAFAGAGVSPRIAEEVWPRANGVGLVRAGLGATFMTPSEAKYLPPEIVFRPLRGPAPESRLVLGWRGSPPPDPALAAFLAVAGESGSPKRASDRSV